LANAHSTEPIVYLFRPIQHLHDEAYDQPYRFFLKQHADQRGVAVADSYEFDYSGYLETDLYLYPGDRHPNEVMHRLYAESFLGTIRSVVDQNILMAK
jgi:hypothetical protein